MKPHNRGDIRTLFLSFLLLVCFAGLSWFFSFRTSVPAWQFVLSGGAIMAMILILMNMRNLESGSASLQKAHQRQGRELGQMKKEIQRRRTESDCLMECCSALFESGDKKELSAAVMEAAGRIFDADQASLMILAEDGTLRIEGHRGLSDEVAQRVQLRLGERVAGLAAYERRDFLLRGELDQYPLLRDIECNPIVRSSMICPLVAEGRVVGVLNLSRTLSEEPFTEQDLRRARILAAQAALAFRYAAMRRYLKTYARTVVQPYRLPKDSQVELLEREYIDLISHPENFRQAS